jgi:hypothetical protein
MIVIQFRLLILNQTFSEIFEMFQFFKDFLRRMTPTSASGGENHRRKLISCCFLSQTQRNQRKTSKNPVNLSPPSHTSPKTGRHSMDSTIFSFIFKRKNF